ncbi:MAG: thiosulfate oxidation carrier complex protein SoxZ [Bauldia sp.]|nr:thiosulfate oxidation carrier complex protein SoxZ [Bauldia sp.]
MSSVAAWPMLARPSGAQEAVPWWRDVESARTLVGDATPSTEGVWIDLPYLSEDGTSVALGVGVDRPMTQESYVQSLHVYALKNPAPEVADYFFSPLSGRAEIATRIRINETMSIGVIARISTGEVIVAEREILIVTIGCLTNAATYATTDVMRTRVRVPEQFTPGVPGEVTTLINHPMETGLRTTLAGETIPRNIVTRFLASVGFATVFEARFYSSVAVNPYLRFFIVPPQSGELVLRWEEDTGLAAIERRPILVG